jgi:hypothetical protein
MALNFAEKLKGLLLNPVETLRQLREEGLGDALTYFIIVLVVYAVMSTIVSMAILQGVFAITGTAFPELGTWMPLYIFGAAIVGGLIGVFVGGAWLHLWVYVFGGKKGYLQTVKSLMYGSTPVMLLGWIPVVSIIGAIWAFFLQILGIRELHGISTGQAVIAVLIAIIIPVIILILLAAFFLISSVSSSPVPFGPVPLPS